jgi:hypothetical protein
MKHMTSEEIHEAIHRALEIVDRQIADGTLDQSGRFYTDKELEAQRAALAASKAVRQSKAPAA